MEGNEADSYVDASGRELGRGSMDRIFVPAGMGDQLPGKQDISQLCVGIGPMWPRD
jgi:hypothetical protein